MRFLVVKCVVLIFNFISEVPRAHILFGFEPKVDLGAGFQLGTGDIPVLKTHKMHVALFVNVAILQDDGVGSFVPVFVVNSILKRKLLVVAVSLLRPEEARDRAINLCHEIDTILLMRLKVVVVHVLSTLFEATPHLLFLHRLPSQDAELVVVLHPHLQKGLFDV